MRLPSISSGTRTLGGAVTGIVTVVSAVLAIQDIARVELSLVAAVGGVSAIWLLVSANLSLRDQVKEARMALAAQSDKETALLALNDRVEEGNDLARRLKAYHPVGLRGPSRRTDILASERRELIDEVSAWNRSCVATAREHARWLAGALDAPIPPRDAAGDVARDPTWLKALRHELAIKIGRIQRIQEALRP